jgi:molybdate transport system ATP-binding protein
MKDYIIKITDAVARNPQLQFAAPVNAEIGVNEHIAIDGLNGVGKSVFVDMLLGKYPLKEGRIEYNFPSSASQAVYDNVKYISFRDAYGTADANYYYQQRWNSTEQDAYPTVREQLGTVNDEQLRLYFFRMFNMEHLLDEKIILLSSGELRKFHIIKALLDMPHLLIIDNPYIGLDAEARHSLNALLAELSQMEYLQIILVLSMTSEIPDFITHVIPVHLKTVGVKFERSDYQLAMKIMDRQKEIEYTPSYYPYKDLPVPTKEIIRLNNVNIRYGSRTILKDLNWVVLEGEKWALSGDNGSGKSTLLSLICADNPQSYACDITLFGRKRGTGESIWDIKKHIGYVSPEMQRAYLKNIPAIDIVASGLYDSIGLYKRPQMGDLMTSEAWMKVFGIVELKDRPYLQLSSGEQRLALLARAFVKDPDLLILDEPFHGLDSVNRRRIMDIIENFCKRLGKTLIMVTHCKDEWPLAITHGLRLENLQRS